MCSNFREKLSNPISVLFWQFVLLLLFLRAVTGFFNTANLFLALRGFASGGMVRKDFCWADFYLPTPYATPVYTLYSKENPSQCYKYAVAAGSLRYI